MNSQEIQELRDLPIESVAERLGLDVKRHKALCPFHDDSNPSLSFSVSRNTFKCFVCDAHGGTIDLAMKVLGKGFRETCEWLAGEHGIYLSRICELVKANAPKPSAGVTNSLILDNKRKCGFDASRFLRYFEHPFLTDAAMHFLFDERHLDPRVIRWCRINSYSDRNGINWLQIPYYDADWKLIGVQLRNLGASLPARTYSDVLNIGLRRESAANARTTVNDQANSELATTTPAISEPTISTPAISELATTTPAPSLRERAGGEALPRFKFPYGSQCHIYNLPVLKMLRPDEPLYIAEGCSDCWALLSAGHKAIAIPSATLLKPSDLESLISQLSPTTQLHMYPDQDAPGEKLFQQLNDLLSRSGVCRPSPYGGERGERLPRSGVCRPSPYGGERGERPPLLIRHTLPQGCKDFSDYYLTQVS